MVLRFQVVPPELYAKLRTLEDILERRAVTREQFEAARACGWPGSDGSSKSPDTVYLVRMGITTDEYIPDLPTLDHDVDYWSLRRLLAIGAITEEQAARGQLAADSELLSRMIGKVEREVWAIARPFARRRCLKYYEAVHAGGRSSRMPREREWYPKPAEERAA